MKKSEFWLPDTGHALAQRRQEPARALRPMAVCPSHSTFRPFAPHGQTLGRFLQNRARLPLTRPVRSAIADWASHECTAVNMRLYFAL